MKPFLPLTVAEQVAQHLRREINQGSLSGVMPGVLKLEVETGVNRKTVEAALRILERDGILRPQGVGKRRLIVRDEVGPEKLRVGVIYYERSDRGLERMQSLQYQLGEVGHQVIEASASLTELGMDVRKVARIVGETRADAWVVSAGSREVLQWFIDEGIPVMAIFGRRRGLPLASVGPDKQSAFRDAIRTLVALGHHRIVLLTRRIRRLPHPGEVEKTFLDELTKQGITTSSYNLPDWEETRAGFNDCLESLFRLTPPTAIIADEAHFYFATRHFLAARGLSVPGDVSMVCTDFDRNFDWCQPTVAHIRWDHRPLVQRVVKWAANISQGKEDHRHTFIRAEFIGGGTISKAKRG